MTWEDRWLNCRQSPSTMVPLMIQSWNPFLAWISRIAELERALTAWVFILSGHHQAAKLRLHGDLLTGRDWNSMDGRIRE